LRAQGNVKLSIHDIFYKLDYAVALLMLTAVLYDWSVPCAAVLHHSVTYTISTTMLHEAALRFHLRNVISIRK
jgi:hypothetical protein